MPIASRDTRHAGADGAALAGLERGLTEVRDALHALTPAENLAGFNEAVNTLVAEDRSAGRRSQDPAALKQLEGAILAMRGIVSHVASNDALATSRRTCDRSPPRSSRPRMPAAAAI